MALIFLCFYRAQAQYWQALPPYNLLWPLWFPLLSPPDPVRGVPTPILTELSKTAILPMQPALLYDNYWWTLVGPASGWPMGFKTPWLFYNSPTGLLFFDMLFYELNHFPPEKQLDPVTGAPVPVTLLAGYSLLETTPSILLKTQANYLFDLANLTYMLGYGTTLGINPYLLSTLSDEWGLTAV